jgi:Domain of unknown function (DUF4332)
VQLLEQLRSVRPVDVRSPLAAVASRWLVRLSAGRLQRIEWPRNFHTDTNSYHSDSYMQSGVTINGREENSMSAADRALAAMAVRIAAGDLMARTGRHVPLVFETHREMFGNLPNTSAAYHEYGDHFQSNHPFAAALRDYARSGRQVVVLTSNQDLTVQLGRVGARTFQIHSERVVHAHRPLWQSQSEHYVGPHPHTYGVRDAADVVNEFCFAEPTYTRTAPTIDINRDFDMAWREAYGLYDNPQHSRIRHSDSTRTDWARDGVDYRDGYYFADTYTTVTPQEPVRYSADAHWIGGKGQQPAAPPPPVRVPAVESPFFLSVDSPIDQAPSIDPVAAARLRGLKVTHINHLMQQDSNRLADALGLANVDAATIRRWQSECRLVCRVPQLRGFDARILVGCGVTTPAELASIHPVDLLRDVESFLSTPRGQQILLSGSSHELSRITSWIAAANSSSNRDFKGFGTNRKRNQEPTRQTVRNAKDVRDDRDQEFAFDSDRYEYEYEHDVDGKRTGRRRRIIRSLNEPETAGGGRSENDFAPARTSRPTNDRNGNGNSNSGNGTSRANRGPGHEVASGIAGGADNSSGRGDGYERQPRPRSRRTVTPYESTPRDVVQYERDRDERERVERDQRERHQREQTERASHERVNRERQPRQSDERRTSERELRFYLSRESLIVDAPSIGARLADRLNAVGIDTVDDLLKADPATMADQLELRYVDADTALQWQQQATLVCRVPMLRGHDAQLLVLAGITNPEQLAACDAEELFGLIDPIANSAEGKRIIRNGKLPDLAEVTEWIDFAQHKRELRAA